MIKQFSSIKRLCNGIVYWGHTYIGHYITYLIYTTPEEHITPQYKRLRGTGVVSELFSYDVCLCHAGTEHSTNPVVGPYHSANCR